MLAVMAVHMMVRGEERERERGGGSWSERAVLVKRILLNDHQKLQQQQCAFTRVCLCHECEVSSPKF